MGQNIYGVDIGTSNFKMCCKDKDKIINEKNIIAIANMKCMRKHQNTLKFPFL